MLFFILCILSKVRQFHYFKLYSINELHLISYSHGIMTENSTVFVTYWILQRFIKEMYYYLTFSVVHIYIVSKTYWIYFRILPFNNVLPIYFLNFWSITFIMCMDVSSKVSTYASKDYYTNSYTKEWGRKQDRKLYFVSKLSCVTRSIFKTWKWDFVTNNRG